MRKKLREAGVEPSSLPLAVDVERWLMRGKTPWDAFPDTNGGKKDAESVGIASALAHENVTLITGAMVTRLLADGGRITAVEYEADGVRTTLHPAIAVLSAGAVNSAALLLRSTNEEYPNGLAKDAPDKRLLSARWS